MFTTNQGMGRHVKAVHNGIKDVSCTHPGCNQMFSRDTNMRMHVKTVHEGIKDVACTHPGCDQMFSRDEHMRNHVKAVHEGIKDIACSHPGCDQMFSQEQHMRTHVKAIHEGIKEVTCTHTGCTRMFSEAGDMRKHVKAVHEGIKEVSCTHPGCNKTFTTNQMMVRHVKSIHNGIKDVACTHPGCDQMFTTNQHMRSHFQSWHTSEGMNRKKKQEHRVREVLSSAYAIDEEIYIRYNGGCVPDPDKYCARIDFGVVGIIPACVIVECDELAHESYLLSCELTRMEQVHEALVTGGEQRPMVFVRYNPNGSFEEDEIPIKMRRRDREQMLLSFLGKVASGELVFTEPLNIVYICYSTFDGEPVVCYDADFSEQMRGCVRKNN